MLSKRNIWSRTSAIFWKEFLNINHWEERRKLKCRSRTVTNAGKFLRVSEHKLELIWNQIQIKYYKGCCRINLKYDWYLDTWICKIWIIIHSWVFFLKRLSLTFTALCLITAGESIYSIISLLSSVLPVIKFYFILNFKQLSSRRTILFLRSLFLVIIKGELHY